MIKDPSFPGQEPGGRRETNASSRHQAESKQKEALWSVFQLRMSFTKKMLKLQGTNIMSTTTYKDTNPSTESLGAMTP